MLEKNNDAFVLGQKWSLDFVISEVEQELFAELSGDRNSLHLDAAAASSVGFPNSVVYGGLLISKLSSIIGMQVPGSLGLWSGVNIDFRNPLFVGQPARMEVELSQISEATRSYVLKVSIHSEGKLIASGRALATLF